MTSGPAGILGIKINSRVMLTVIVDFEEERVNDQMGSVKHIQKDSNGIAVQI